MVRTVARQPASPWHASLLHHHGTPACFTAPFPGARLPHMTDQDLAPCWLDCWLSPYSRTTCGLTQCCGSAGCATRLQVTCMLTTS